MKYPLGIAVLLLATFSFAGEVVVNGVPMGKFTSLVINYKDDPTGLFIISTQPPKAIPPPVAIPGDFELVKCFRTKMDLYLFIRANKYPGTVFVDGVRIRSGAKAPVIFQRRPNGEVCQP